MPIVSRELRNLASMPITEEVLDEMVEKKETPMHHAKDKETLYAESIRCPAIGRVC